MSIKNFVGHTRLAACYIRDIFFEDQVGWLESRDKMRAELEEFLSKDCNKDLQVLIRHNLAEADVCNKAGHLIPLRHPPHRFTCVICKGMFDLAPGYKNAFI